MDSATILLALEEQSRWRDRRRRLEERLKANRTQRQILRRELGIVRRRLVELGRTLGQTLLESGTGKTVAGER